VSDDDALRQIDTLLERIVAWDADRQAHGFSSYHTDAVDSCELALDLAHQLRRTLPHADPRRRGLAVMLGELEGYAVDLGLRGDGWQDTGDCA